MSRGDHPASGMPGAADEVTPNDRTLGTLLTWGTQRLRATGHGERLDAQLLLAHVTGWPRSTVMAFPEREVAADAAQRYLALIARRATGEPFALITGRREFYGLPLRVTAATLVPRPETEMLVDLALAALPADRPVSVLDLGTGSGAIALAIRQHRPLAAVTAVDESHEALAVARHNAEALSLPVRFVQSHWFAELGDARYDAICSNPPYVHASDPALDLQLRFEPRQALVAGPEGLDAIRQIFAAAPAHMWPHSRLLIEHGSTQRDGVARLAADAGLQVSAVHKDLAGHDRVSVLLLRR
jgi:release factor glutamine methyltransferase